MFFAYGNITAVSDSILHDTLACFCVFVFAPLSAPVMD